MDCIVVSHFHWDREWYRTFETYRARLADAVDRVLELLDADPDYRFLLDGQTVVLEDYLAVRPQRRAALSDALHAGRLSTGPWYVQPDSLLPSGEALVRNLLYGRRVADPFGGGSRIAYVPDSFGHPAQFPQLFTGFGMTTFIYWRGNGSEIDDLGRAYRWVAPNGSEVEALLLRDGYFNAACLPADALDAATRIAEHLAHAPDDGHPRILMNGFDHMLPDPHVGDVVETLSRLTEWPIRRGLLEDAARGPLPTMPVHRGALIGGRLANLLPGVWSTRLPIKLANRRCEALLEGWAEPWSAFASALGGPDETPALRLAWQQVLYNQAHDSICGCSLDAVDLQVRARYDTAEGLARETTTRLLERLAGHDVERRTPDSATPDIAVFNPSPFAVTDVVRIALDPYPSLKLPVGQPEFPALFIAMLEQTGFTVDGRPARLIDSDDPTRARWLPFQPALDLEVVVADVPPFGYRRLRLERAERLDDVVDEGRLIGAGDIRVAVADDGTLDLDLGGHRYRGLFGLEDRGDRGDTYDFDAFFEDRGAALLSVSWQRLRHPSGLQRLLVTRVYSVPAGADAEHRQRLDNEVPMTLTLEARVAPGVSRVDVRVRLDNTARDHRVRLLFPTGAAPLDCVAATTFDIGAPPIDRADDLHWLHPAPSTFPHQGWVYAGGLAVGAPGLPEAEVTADGTIAVTLLRAVGWISRVGLGSRAQPAGPMMPVEGAQMLGRLEANLSLSGTPDLAALRADELGLRAVIAGAAPLLPPDTSLLELLTPFVHLSACKPAEDGDGVIIRLLNAADVVRPAALRLGLPIASVESVRLDETPDGDAVRRDGDTLHLTVGPHALRSLRVRFAAAG
ncbi:MAG: glycosyl hydrolase-related protein [Deltaproteobacteria bacterium]|nr:glycosyl hydrolase-related protein [Deltaproteobacteria bacterium]